jgi:3-hydroxyacyl-CoA dehydrogenase
MGAVIEVQQVAVIGSDERGSRVALAASLAGCTVRLQDPDPAALDRAQASIRNAVEAALAAGRIGPADKQRALDGILSTTDLEEAVTHADLVVEAAARRLPERRSLFMTLGQACRATALLATVDGAPDDLIDWLPQPGRLLGLDVPDASRDGPVRIRVGVETSDDAVRIAERFAARLGLPARVVSARGDSEADPR